MSAQAPVYENTNGVPLCDGKNLHMDVGFGDIANRVVTVGSPSRAEKIATKLDAEPAPKTITSSRGFTTITGAYNGVPVSIVAIGMGPAMMDFFVRETRAVVKGPMAMVRYGTCGGLTLEASAGSVIVANAGSAYVCRDPDAFSACYSGELGSNCSVSGSGYRFSQVAPADVELSALLLGELRAYAEGKPALALSIGEGCNVTADSFYSSQGRIDPSFCDDNSVIIDTLLKKYPSAKTMEMETFFLLHLARCCKIPIKAAAAAIVVANRPTGTVMDGDLLDELEREGGEAVLKAITLVPL